MEAEKKKGIVGKRGQRGRRKEEIGVDSTWR